MAGIIIPPHYYLVLFLLIIIGIIFIVVVVVVPLIIISPMASESLGAQLQPQFSTPLVAASRVADSRSKPNLHHLVCGRRVAASSL